MPLCEYLLDSPATAANWSPDGVRLVVGTLSVSLYLLALCNVPREPVIVTAWGSDWPEPGASAFGCPLCRVWSPLSSVVHLTVNCPSAGSSSGSAPSPSMLTGSRSRRRGAARWEETLVLWLLENEHVDGVKAG